LNQDSRPPRRNEAAQGSVVARSRRTRALLFLSAISWLVLVFGGMWLLSGYENAPGLAAESPLYWPAESRIQPAHDHATLVMLAHPRCPCTRASIGELASIMAHSQGRLSGYVLFIKPEGSSNEWQETDLWQSASSIPGVKVILDPDGREARLFSAATSGQTVLYDPQGRLLFSGGITGSRGHFGDNAGQASIVSLVNAEVPDRTETSVFGCPLFDPKSDCRISIDERNKN
jgi:hypothetical protein